MKKKILVILLFTFIIASAILIYLNNFVLPVKLRSLIITGLKEATQKQVELGQVSFNIFKGLVIRDLVLLDGAGPIIRLKEGACAFVIPAFFKKTVLIPTISLSALEIFLERRPDSTFNISELFSVKSGQEKKSKFALIVRKIKLNNGTMHFKDNLLPVPFVKEMRNISLVAYLSLPARVKFTVNSEIVAAPVCKLEVLGEYLIPQQLLNTKVTIGDFSPKEFSPYYQQSGISIPSGLVSAVIKGTFKNDLFACEAQLFSNALTIIKKNITTQLTSTTGGKLQYDFRSKGIRFSGTSQVNDSSVSGVAVVEEIASINGEVKFDTTAISAQNLRAKVWNMPVQVKARLADFSNPAFTLTASVPVGLDALSNILKDKFKFSIPAQLSGESKLLVNLNFQPTFQFDGYLDIKEGQAKLEKLALPIEDIQGRLSFNDRQLDWSGLRAAYDQKQYSSSGSIVGYKVPRVQWELASDEWDLKTNFTYIDKLLSVQHLQGRYLNSKFALQGTVDTVEPPGLDADLSGALELSLGDLPAVINKFKPQLEASKLAGLLHTKFQVHGNISDLSSCDIITSSASEDISAYGLRGTDFFMDFTFKDKLIDIPAVRFLLYEGKVELGARMNLNAAAKPYWLNILAQGIKLEKLKNDTTSKDKELAGTVQFDLKANGSANDPAKLNGAGSLLITNGNLWELNLFKGLGSLLFIKDFAHIIFSQGSCDFLIENQKIFTDNVLLKSEIVNLAGPVKIGFDNSLDASLNVEVLSEMVPLTGTFKDITTAIIGKAGRFGVIVLSGTLKDPKYKFKPAVVDIIKGIKDMIFRK